MLFACVYGFLRVCGEDRPHCVSTKRVRKHAATRSIVVDHQNAQPPELGILGRHDFRSRTTQDRSEAERATTAGLAVYPYFPMHQVNQSRRDGETEPCAAVLPRPGAIRLRKGLEDEAQLFSRNSNTGVNHCEMKSHRITLLRLCIHRDRHFAPVRKLNCISEKIEKNLPQ